MNRAMDNQEVNFDLAKPIKPEGQDEQGFGNKYDNYCKTTEDYDRFENPHDKDNFIPAKNYHSGKYMPYKRPEKNPYDVNHKAIKEKEANA
jgi:hypothetical protein